MSTTENLWFIYTFLAPTGIVVFSKQFFLYYFVDLSMDTNLVFSFALISSSLGFIRCLEVVACFTGFNVLVGVCCALFYCVITSQEQRRPNLKLWLIPLAPVVICLLFLFVGIIQRKPKLLYPFIVLQIFSGFGTAVSMAMIIISVPCNTKHILRLIVDVNLEEAEYKRSAMTIFSVLSLTLFVQIWYLRTVCNCFRYFTDLQKFEERTANV